MIRPDSPFQSSGRMRPARSSGAHRVWIRIRDPPGLRRDNTVSLYSAHRLSMTVALSASARFATGSSISTASARADVMPPSMPFHRADESFERSHSSTAEEVSRTRPSYMARYSGELTICRQRRLLRCAGLSA